MNIAIFSFAHMHAYSYARSLKDLPGVTLKVVADDDVERGRQAAETFGARYVRDYQDALKEPLDAVIVTSENSRHAEMTVAALQAGLHVLCEKPIATRIEDGHRMVQAAHDAKKLLQMAFPMRYNIPAARLKQQLDQGRLGRILLMNGTNHGKNPGGWFIDPVLAGGGAVMDHTVHVVDLMRWYTGSEVREVYAEIDTRFHPIGIDDTGLLTLEFENGVIAALDPSWSRPQRSFPTWGDVTLEVVGTEGVTHLDAFAQHLVLYKEIAGQAQHLGWGDDPDLRMLESFIACIRAGTPPLASGHDGLQATQVALACYESARLARPVKISQ